jgi:hypothetical protein
MEGVGGVKALLSPRPPRLNAASEGVVGVVGNESLETVGEARLYALLDGRNMPEPGIDVVKYRVLQSIVSRMYQSPIA